MYCLVYILKSQEIARTYIAYCLVAAESNKEKYKIPGFYNLGSKAKHKIKPCVFNT
jgi:hypothetical protein